MFPIFVLFAVASSAFAGYSGTDNTNDNKVTGGYGYGYSGSFSGDGAPPNFPQFPQFDFQNFLQQYVGSLRKYHEQLIGNDFSYAFSTAHNGKSQAKSSISSKSAGQFPGGYAGYGFPGGVPAYAGFQGQQHYSGNGGEGAAASAAFGPGGIHQTAGVFPENPNSPNINTRFAASPDGAPGGFHSVSTSSFSSSSDVNGKPSSFHQASTTVNDNGKVTTYTVRKP
ncbi:uncharacterized protein [Onthophagus taurus]|uniref:uncharacterized protein isoform X1 n=1 Tax=Onthophagus taurus TaxID=166361 RepID=UPI000C2065DA|nr:5'-3' exoribonuclease 2 isoform X1 [Onthophagus taurus]